MLGVTLPWSGSNQRGSTTCSASAARTAAKGRDGNSPAHIAIGPVTPKTACISPCDAFGW